MKLSTCTTLAVLLSVVFVACQESQAGGCSSKFRGGYGGYRPSGHSYYKGGYSKPLYVTRPSYPIPPQPQPHPTYYSGQNAPYSGPTGPYSGPMPNGPAPFPGPQGQFGPFGPNGPNGPQFGQQSGPQFGPEETPFEPANSPAPTTAGFTPTTTGFQEIDLKRPTTTSPASTPGAMLRGIAFKKDRLN